MKNNQVRIIAGKWRGRKLEFSAAEGLRPTSDRVRETLFNWLMPFIQGARCLDLFAGSGALSFESLSRGAAHVTTLDQSNKIIMQLHQVARLFNAENANFICANTLEWLKKTSNLEPFDIVFIDPPFHQGLVKKTLDVLLNSNLLNKKVYLYIEQENSAALPMLPENYLLIKQIKTVETIAMLFEKTN